MFGSEFKVMGHEHDGTVFPLKFGNKFDQLPPERFVLSSRGFIKNNQLGFDRKGRSKRDSFLLPFAQHERRSLKEGDKPKTVEEFITPGWIIGTKGLRAC